VVATLVADSRNEKTMTRGWWNLACWNGLSADQQNRLINVGNLPIGYRPEGGGCNNGAEVCVETMYDTAPGPRFYCVACAVEYLKGLKA
jgi:hypothetical protein